MILLLYLLFFILHEIHNGHFSRQMGLCGMYPLSFVRYRSCCSGNHLFPFCDRPAPVIEQAVEHQTMLYSKDGISETKFVNAAKHSSIYVAELAHPNAPECAYFSITPNTEVCSPVVSIFPVNAEPGELTTKLRVDLNMFRRSPNEYKLYFCGATLPQNGKHYSSNNRVVLMFARTDDWERVENLGFRELDMEDNSILRWDKETDQWFVASEMRTDLNRPIQVIVAVANGANVEHGNMQWFETCRVHYVRSCVL